MAYETGLLAGALGRPAAEALNHRWSENRTALFLASRDMLKDRKVAVLVVTVLAFSFVNLVFFTSFQYGLETYIRDQLVATVTSHVVIGPNEDHDYVEGVDTIQAKLRLIPGIVGSAALLEEPGVQARYKSKTIGTEAVGVVPSEYATVSAIPRKLVDGEFLSDEDTDQVVLGTGIARGTLSEGTVFRAGGGILGTSLDVEVGQRIQLAFTNGEARSYRVKGIVDTGGLSADFSAFLTRKEMDSIFPETKDEASEILVRLSDINAANDYKHLILAEGIRGTVKTWEDMALFVKQIEGTISVVAAVTSGVGIIAVAVTIAIIIYINSAQKRRLTGVLKAVGATDSVILRIYLYEALLFTVLGIAGGAVLSLAMGALFHQIPIPAPLGGGIVPDIREGLLVQGGLSMVAASLAAAAYPSWRAARQPIVRSIWG